jgi:hypothetical protein
MSQEHSVQERMQGKGQGLRPRLVLGWGGPVLGIPLSLELQPSLS